MPGLAAARALVLEHGWNATAYQILNRGITLWFAAAGDAVVGWRRASGFRVVAGAPVCPLARLADVAREFEADALAGGERVCYFGAEARLEALYGSSDGHALILLGAQPAWTPASWSAIVAGRRSLRAQLNRARNKGVAVSEWSVAKATAHPELTRLLTEWLATRGLPPMGFLVEPRTLDRLWDRRVFVAARAGVAIAFLVASPVPARNGWLVEQFVRGAGAVNGTAELLIDHAVRAMARDGAGYVTLGLAPLSRRARRAVGRPDPAWLRLAFRLLRAHGRRFYNFDGLDEFKAKFGPERWEPVYAVVDRRTVGPMPIYAIASAFTNGRPIRAVARGIVAALRAELTRAVARGAARG